MSRVDFEPLEDGLSDSLGDELNARFEALREGVNESLPTPREWTSALQVLAGDPVTHQGQMWLAKVASVGEAPSEGASWTLLVSNTSPDGSITDAKIGSRTVDESTSHDSPTGTITQLLSWLAKGRKALGEALAAHVARTDNPHATTKSQVGLGAVDNVSAAQLRDRATHTGTQAASTITGLGGAATLNVGTVAGTVAAGSHVHTITDLPVASPGFSTSLAVPRADDPRLSDARVPLAHSHAALDSATFNATPGTLVQRNGAGQAQFSPPTASSHAATKDYVDTQYNDLAARCGSPVQSLAALRAVNTTSLGDKQIRLVEDEGALFRFDSEGTGADDNSLTIAPTTGPGRWFKAQVATSDHNALVGLQGGSTNDRQHLTTAQVNALPTAAQKSALTGTSGAPGAGNEFVTNSDARLSNARTPTAHNHALADLPVASSGTFSSTDLVRADDGRLYNQRTPSPHSHAFLDITGLSGALAGYIEGLGLRWISNTQVAVGVGAAWVQGMGTVVELTVEAVLSPARAASTWYYVYLWSNAGTPTIEVSTTAPAAPYRGTARAKQGDITRRFLGSYRTDGSSNILNFLRVGAGNVVEVCHRFQTDTAPYRVLNQGTATSRTSVSLAAVVPPTSRIAAITINNTASGGGLNYIFTATSDDSTLGAGSQYVILPNQGQTLRHPLAADQTMVYLFSNTPASGGAFIDVRGYVEER